MADNWKLIAGAVVTGIVLANLGNAMDRSRRNCPAAAPPSKSRSRRIGGSDPDAVPAPKPGRTKEEQHSRLGSQEVLLLCEGKKVVPNDSGQNETCPTCKGAGQIDTSIFLK